MNVPKKPDIRKASKFYWWRRFPIPKYDSKKPLLYRIKSGEFDPSPYLEQAQWEKAWMQEEINEETNNYQNASSIVFEDEVVRPVTSRYMKRVKKLTKDSWADEDKRIKALVRAFRIEFTLPEEALRDFFSNFEGTVMECYDALTEFCNTHHSNRLHRKHVKTLFKKL
jgi:hypothetical protein